MGMTNDQVERAFRRMIELIYRHRRAGKMTDELYQLLICDIEAWAELQWRTPPILRPWGRFPLED